MAIYYTRVFELLGDGKPYGLSLASSLTEIQEKFSDVLHVKDDKRLIVSIGDLEFGSVDLSGSSWSYIRLNPGSELSDNLIVGDTIREKVSKHLYNIRNFLDYFIQENIQFTLDATLSYEDEQRCVVTEFDDQLFFTKAGNGNYHLDKIFFVSI